ncbi:MAG: maltose ABC transporter substrate-binding protein, partial [Hungatella hathewayi]|nr:maltose ABC transporter substrate-binding protein [Hungatella hathewayi]
NIVDFRNAGVNFGVMTMPTLNGRTPTPFAGLKVAHVSAYPDYPHAAMLLAEYMASEPGAIILYDTNYKTTALKDISAVPELLEDRDLSVFSRQFETAFPVPNIDRMDYYYSISEKALALVFDGQLEPAEAAKKAMEEWNSLVASE